MSPSAIVKLNFLVVAFGLTLFFMYQVNKKGLSPKVLAIFGIEGASPRKNSLDWCDTRVVALIKPNKFKLFQDGSQWLLESKNKRVVDFIQVEKWFARNCRVSIRPSRVSSVEGFTPALLVKYVSGEVEMLASNELGIFRWRDNTFTAPALTQALNEIEFFQDGRVK